MHILHFIRMMKIALQNGCINVYSQQAVYGCIISPQYWSYLIFTNLTGNTNELSFTLHFPDYKMRLSSLYMFIGHLYFHFCDTTYLFHFKNVLFVFLLLSFNRPSSILDTTLYLLGTLQMISSNYCLTYCLLMYKIFKCWCS